MPHQNLLSVPPERAAAARLVYFALAGARRVGVTTHINGDGDACGSVAAMCRLLRQQGFTPRVITPTPWPATFDFLLDGDIDDVSRMGVKALRDIDALVVLDVSDVSRLGQLADTVRKLTIPRVVIDHHVPTDEPAGDLLMDDPAACASGELVYDYAATHGLELTPSIAEALYTALLTDTGGFRYANTTPRCHAIAATLLATGVDPETMYRRIYASVSPGRIFLLRDALDTIGHDAEHGISWISVTADALARHDVSAEDLDGIVEHPRSIIGTRLALFFRDLGYGKVKVSFRSTGDVDVNRFARDFGGGGHAKASGALIPGTLEQVRERVIGAAREYIGAVAAP